MFVLVLLRLAVVAATLIANGSAGWPARSRNETDRNHHRDQCPLAAFAIYRFGNVGSWLQANVSGSLRGCPCSQGTSRAGPA